MTRWRRLGATAATLVLLLIAWELVSRSVPAYLLPGPSQVAGRWMSLWTAGVIPDDLVATLWEALLGFLLAASIGTAVGFAVARWRIVDELLAPALAASQAMPMVAFAPLLAAWLGLGLMPKVLTAALVIFFPILVNCTVALRSIDGDVTDAARTDGAGALRTFVHIELPLSLPIALGGVKVGVTLAMTGALVGEFIASDGGLGYLMNLGRTEYDGAVVLAAALTVVAVTILAYAGVDALERLARRRI